MGSVELSLWVRRWARRGRGEEEEEEGEGGMVCSGGRGREGAMVVVDGGLEISEIN